MIFRSPYPDIDMPNQALTAFVLRNASRLPDKPALADASCDRVMTFGGLRDDVTAVANGLAQRGFGQGNVIGIYAPNCIEYPVIVLAAASLGGIATTVNPLATAGELTRQLVDADAVLLVTTPALLSAALDATSASSVREVFVIGGEEGGATAFADLRNGMSMPTAWPTIAGDDLALLPYSSGTTGLPKGVMVTHAGWVANLRQCSVPQFVSPDDVVFCLPPFFHMYGAFVMTHILNSGGTLVFAPRFDMTSFLSAVERYKVTRAYLVPPIIIALLNDPAARTHDLSSLNHILSGGAPLDGDLGARCQEQLGCTVGQGYGLTEMSPVTHVVPITGRLIKKGSVGPCLPNSECKLMDLTLGIELGPNEQGELWIRGPQMMKGYLNQPEATAQMITPDGWLRTGDIGYADEDGDFFIVDRLKELIKYKAYQVAPAELEALLLSHPDVLDVAVIPVDDDEAGEIPKAWVVRRGDVTAEELMAFVADQVASYKKIRRLEFTDQIPKSATGKILRRILVERERIANALA